MTTQEVKVEFSKKDRDILISIDTSLKEIVKIERGKKASYIDYLNKQNLESIQNMQTASMIANLNTPFYMDRVCGCGCEQS